MQHTTNEARTSVALGGSPTGDVAPARRCWPFTATASCQRFYSSWFIASPCTVVSSVRRYVCLGCGAAPDSVVLTLLFDTQTTYRTLYTDGRSLEHAPGRVRARQRDLQLGITLERQACTTGGGVGR